MFISPTIKKLTKLSLLSESNVIQNVADAEPAYVQDKKEMFLNNF